MGERIRRDEGNVPTVGVLGGDAQRDLLATAADPEWKPRLNWLRLALRVSHGEELAVEVGAVLGEESPHALDCFVHLAEPDSRRRVLHAVGRVLLLHPPTAEAEGDATVRDLVEGGCGVR